MFAPMCIIELFALLNKCAHSMIEIGLMGEPVLNVANVIYINQFEFVLYVF